MLSDAQRQAITDTLGDREADLVEQVYLQLERIAEGYQALEHDRELNPPSKALIYLQQERKRVSKLITGLCGRRETLVVQLIDFRQHLIAGHNEIEPELWRLIREAESRLANLQTERRCIFSYIDNCNAEVRRFHRKSNPHRESMYIGVLRIWTSIAAGELAYSRSPKGPCGPLINFFRACLMPILNDKTPGASGLADIIDRVRDPEQHAKRKKRQT